MYHKYAPDIEQAAYEIGQFCRRWGFIGVRQTKEKFGTARVYCNFGISSIHDLVWPGYVYNQWQRLGKIGKIIYWCEWKIILPVINFSRINFFITHYQSFIYKLAYKRAMKKFPHVAANIKHGADYGELLKGLCSKNS